MDRTHRFEHRSEPLLPHSAFRKRLARRVGYAVGYLLASLLLGTIGFHLFAGQEPIDAFLNAAMLLGGMGPVGEIKYFGGKLFAGVFALYAGLAFIAITGYLLAPYAHRLLHRFHLEEESRRRSQ